MLALDRVGKTYPNGVHALERFSAEIKPGEIVAIIGGSGWAGCSWSPPNSWARRKASAIS